MNTITTVKYDTKQTTIPRSVSLLLKPEPFFRVVSTWADAQRILKPSKGTILLHDTKYMPVTKRRKIFIQYEPEIIYHMREFLLKNSSYYDFILTYDHVVLSKCPNARRYICAESWVPLADIQSIDVSRKEFKLTGIFTHILYGIGHIFRRVIYHRQKELCMPRMFYRSGMRGQLDEIEDNPVFSSTSSKIKLFETAQFSLAIENSEQTDYFSEKIIDCLVTKTIPIYWGCPNIEQYFDTTGWIRLERPCFDELQAKLGMLTPDYYSQYKDVIEKNFRAAMYYSDYYTNVNRGLMTIPNY